MVLVDVATILVLVFLLEVAAYCRHKHVKNMDWVIIIIVLLLTAGVSR